MSPQQTKKAQVADYLRGLINSGELPPGALVPTEEDLRDLLGVARSTVRDGLQILTSEGLIGAGASGEGKRRAVLSRNLVEISLTKTEEMGHRLTVGTDAWVSDLHDQGMEAVPPQSISVTVEDASRRVAELLHVTPGDLLYVRRRVRYADGKAHNLNDTYYPQWVTERCPRIMSPHDVPEGIIAYMAAQGFKQVWYTDEIEARQPNPEEARLLNLGAGCVMDQFRTGYVKDTETGELAPVKLTHTIWPGDRTRLKGGYPA